MGNYFNIENENNIKSVYLKNLVDKLQKNHGLTVNASHEVYLFLKNQFEGEVEQTEYDELLGMTV